MKPLAQTTSLRLENCIVCNQSHHNGIHLFSHFICSSCERKMVETEPHEEYYKYCLEKLRIIKIPKSG
ncbi:sigma factor G inhibitor Gin [Alkalihalobacillus sp. LMS39]|uniref:sigma factor G inhibitor Gin n=1 Tax=Alkalihalobacillus sp. LMS39 TaxID=2924032 RepID=UPI001FB3EEF0|nr:sigma factor G inhibitor Gin [Alkalihalobacillus sp. LMS39]UOE94168.1 sigma factor G inhibitor Gin [Alkalihalobacillus sp. LMS39]